MPQIQFRLGFPPRPRAAGGAQVQYSPRPPSWILGVLLISEGKGKEDRGWEWEGSERRRGREGERGRREGRGPGSLRCGRGKKGGKENGGDKSPGWSSHDLGSTVTWDCPTSSPTKLAYKEWEGIISSHKV